MPSNRVVEFPAKKRIEARIGPIHGDQPAPNAIPNIRLLKNPLFLILKEAFFS